MESIIFYGYELLVSLLPFFAVFALLRCWRKQEGTPDTKRQGAVLILFVLYLIAVYHFTGVGTLYDGLRRQWEINLWQVNWIPFSREIDGVGYLLNILLFLPLGFLAPLLWKKWDHAASMLGAGLGFSLLIEASQLLNVRSTDVDDLILNTLGALVGFLLYRVFAYITHRRSRPQASPPISLSLCIGVTFLGRFLLFHEMGLARLLYGF